LSLELARYFEHAGLPRVPTSYDELGRVPLLFDPGARWAYGINTDVAGKAAERASGQRLDLYLAEHLLGPLGMHDTGVTLSPEQRGRMTRMHARGSPTAASRRWSTPPASGRPSAWAAARCAAPARTICASPA
jgi:CubicO group peptidase (beta-lactamase class C family)